MCLLVTMFASGPVAYAAEGHLSVGAPTGNGSVDVYVHFPGVFPGKGADSNGNVLVNVTGIKSGEGAASKAKKIADAINAAFNADVASVGPAAGGGVQVNLTYNKNGTLIAGNAWVPLNGDKTNEGKALSSLDFQPPGSALTALIGFDTGLSGVDITGNVSSFTAEFGYDGLDDTVTVTYDQLLTPTLDGLTSTLYDDLLNGLPPDLQSQLHLDLADDAITFDLPTGQTDYFAGALSTDSDVETSGGLVTAVPEPSSFLLFTSGGVFIAALIGKRGLSATL